MCKITKLILHIACLNLFFKKIDKCVIYIKKKMYFCRLKIAQVVELVDTLL